ncbi:chaplin [Streptomyces sp. S.PNR 29]|uniref:chaplin n=1 Tax=Streptomyces sp. S.PNR 29 TaxID=2973805 RepID=UPI0025B07DA0|nr:chaplin [Streptomyces sp. S.PNR 29]MDN0199069.1 chaplin family protein [Streptomyces sp. S.PNR 29]
MRRATRNGVIAVAAASGAMAVTFPAYADSEAAGTAAGSAGVISGNTVQLPVHVPVNVCGNTVNVAGILNPAVGNKCANEDKARNGADAPGGAVAQGGGEDSPGVLSGNSAQLPVHLPVNVSGNSVNGVGVGNSADGNESTNTSGNRPDRPDRPERPIRPAPKPTAPPEGRSHTEPTPHSPPRVTASLAHTGADHALSALAGGAALVLGGAVLYRRFRPRADS